MDAHGMRDMNRALSSEDEALLRIVDGAIDGETLARAEDDTSIEGFCIDLAGSRAVADEKFRLDLLSALQSRVANGAEVAKGEQDVGDERVASARVGGSTLPVRPTSISGRKVSSVYVDRAAQVRRLVMTLGGMAATLLLLVGFAALLESSPARTFPRVSSGLSDPAGGSGNNADGWAALRATSTVPPQGFNNVALTTPAQPICGLWRTLALPTIEGRARLEAVTAVEDEVWAVGYSRGAWSSESRESDLAKSLILQWDGTAWKQASVPHVGDASNQLYGIAGVHADDVWAVGHKGTFTYERKPQELNAEMLILHWDGQSWQEVQGPDLSGKEHRLMAVAVVASDDVWAVGFSGGYYETVVPEPTPTGDRRERFVPSVPLILHWDGQSWTQVDAPVPGTFRSELYELSVVDKDYIWASGLKVSEEGRPIGVPNTEPWMGLWDGVRWQEVAMPAIGNIVNGVSGSGRGSAWMVGSLASEGGSEIKMARWDGANWLAYALPTPRVDAMSGPPQSNLSAVLEVAENDAWAVGAGTRTESGGGSEPLVLHWDGVAWNRVQAQTPASETFVGVQTYGMMTGLTSGRSGELWVVGVEGWSNWAGWQERPIVLRFERGGCE